MVASEGKFLRSRIIQYDELMQIYKLQGPTVNKLEYLPKIFKEKNRRKDREYFKESFYSYDEVTKEKVPTTSFGVINFNEDPPNKICHYLRMASDTNLDEIHNLLIKHWKLNPPGFIISIIGEMGTLHMSKLQQEAIETGLLNITKDQDAWITTYGVNGGITKLCGELRAFKQGVLINEELCILGIVPWKKIYGNSMLISSDGEGLYPALYSTAASSSRSRNIILDNNHTHYIFYEDPPKSSSTEEKFRIDIETHMESIGENTRYLVIVVGGGSRIITDVIFRLEKQIACVVFDGTGGAADVIAYTFFHGDQINAGDKTAVEELRSLIASKFIDENIDADAVYANCQKLLQDPSLLTVHTLLTNSPAGVDKAILKGLLKKYQFIGDQLQKVLSSSMLDIAQDIMESDCTLTPEILNPLLVIALKECKIEFAKLFMSYGADIHSITNEDIEKHFWYYEVNKKNLNIKNHLKCILSGEVGSPLDNDTRTKYIGHVLLIHSIFKLNADMMKYMWSELNQPINGAMFVSGVLKYLLKEVQKIEKREEMTKLAEVFEMHAVHIINESWRSNQNATIRLLTVDDEFFGTDSARMAIFADCKEVLSTSALQHAFKKKWGGCVADNSAFMLLAAFHTIVLIPFLNYSDIFGSKPPMLKAINSFYNTPMIKFIGFAEAHLIFSLMIFYFLTIGFNRTGITRYELTILVFGASRTYNLILDFIHLTGTLFERIKLIFQDIFLFVECISVGCHILAIITRTPLFISNEALLHTSNDVFYVIAFLGYSFKVVHMMYIHPTLGPTLNMIGLMLAQTTVIVAIAAIFMLSFGILSYITRVVSITKEVQVMRTRQFLNEVVFYPYYRIFCNYWLDEEGFSPTLRENVYIVIAMALMLVCHALLLNMLVGIYGQTFERIQNNAENIWKKQRFLILLAYETMDTFPGILDLLIKGLQLLFRIIFYCRIYPIKKIELVPAAITCWEKRMCHKYLKTLESGDLAFDVASKELVEIHRNVDADGERIYNLQDRFNSLAALLNWIGEKYTTDEEAFPRVKPIKFYKSV